MTRRILPLLASAFIGFGFGIGLLFQFYPRSAWFAANVPGGLLFSRFGPLGSSVWMVPIANAVAYAAIAFLFIGASALVQGFGKRASG